MTRVEGRSGDLYDQEPKATYRSRGHADTMRCLFGREIYENPETMVDRFEDAAEEIHGIVLENG